MEQIDPQSVQSETAEESLKCLKNQAARQGKAKILGSKYFHFLGELIPLRTENEVIKKCEEFGFLLNEELCFFREK